jgi:hypothetical protein
VLLSSGDSFPHLIKKPSSQLGFVTYLLNCPRIYGSTISQMERAGPSATSVNFYQFSSQLLDSCRHNNSTSRICNFVCLFVSTAVPCAACAVCSVPPLSFDVDELRFWVRFLAASEMFITSGAFRQLLPFTLCLIRWESRPLAGYKTVGALK